ncbi:hypothetical protein IW138_001450 [Coemansia sp. RSA 986]|nr:hypothetical protein IW138_001450 [Coemansia sp. RSA 986]
MSTTKAKGADKEQAAKLIADWATEELGFRKKSTLVTAKGEETIQPVELEPLLQGRLAHILELASAHIVSSQNASFARRRLAEYCDQLGPTNREDAPDLAYISLFTGVKSMRAKEKHFLSEIDGTHRQNYNVIQQINDLEAKKTSAEHRIRELRLQILMKQAMAENLRQMSTRVKGLTREMMPGSSLVQPSDISQDVVRSVLSASAIDKDELEDRCVQMWREIQTTQERANSKKDELVEKVERIAGQISMNTEAANVSRHSPDTAELRNAIFQSVIHEAASHINERLGSLVPDLVSQSRSMWSHSDSGEKTDQITQTVGRIQTLLSDIKQCVADVEGFVSSKVFTENKRFVHALVYADPREAWNAVDIWRLQHLTIDSSDQTKRITKPADKLVTSSNLVEVERLQKIGGIFSQTPGISGQAHELAVASIGENLVQGLRQVHVMENVRASLAESKARMARLLLLSEGSLANHDSITLEDTIDRLCAESRHRRSSAGTAIKDWVDRSKAEGILRLVAESEATEERIAHLSDTSGRLFTDSFAPWHKRDGVSYAEYLKQLKIARASDSR